MHVGLLRLAGVGWPRWDDERDVDLLDPGPGGVWQGSGPLWSYGHSLKRKNTDSGKIVNKSDYSSLSDRVIVRYRPVTTTGRYGKMFSANFLFRSPTSPLKFRPHPTPLL